MTPTLSPEGPAHPAALHNLLLQAGGCGHQESDGLPRPRLMSHLGQPSQLQPAPEVPVTEPAPGVPAGRSPS